MIVCEEKKWVGGKKERITLYIILLSSLYYFIGLFILFYWVICKNKNYDVGWVVKWVGKIDKVVFKNAKLVFFFFFFFFYTSPNANAANHIKSFTFCL